MVDDRRVLIILNPTAGRGRAASRIGELLLAFQGANITYDLVQTESKCQAIVFASNSYKQGYAAIVAAGGDGTVNEVINGLATACPAYESLGPVGVYPIGTGNDLAHTMHFSSDARALTESLLRGRTRRVDIGLATLRGEMGEVRRYFHNSLGFGLEASVTQESDRIQHLSGGLVYVVAAFRALRSYETPMTTVEWQDGRGVRKRVQQEISVLSIGNAKRTGGAFYLTPDAEVNDGLFDVVLAESMSRIRMLGLLPRALVGKHIGAKGVRMLRCTEITARSASPLPAHMDGEVVMSDALEASAVLEPGRLEILA